VQVAERTPLAGGGERIVLAVDVRSEEEVNRWLAEFQFASCTNWVIHGLLVRLLFAKIALSSAESVDGTTMCIQCVVAVLSYRQATDGSKRVQA
jgi:hypothetical protein